MSRRISAIAIAVVGVVLLAMAHGMSGVAVARADGPAPLTLHRYSYTFHMTKGQQRDEHMDCVPGERALAGGWNISSDGLFYVTRSVPVDSDTWGFRFINGGVEEGDVTMYVTCAPVMQTLGTKVKFATYHINFQSSFGAGTAVCDAGSKVYAGGFNLSSDSGVLRVQGSYPSASDRWTVEVSNRYLGTTDVAVFAVCLPRAAADAYVGTTSFSAFTVAFWARGKQATAACADGYRILGGGFRNTTPTYLSFTRSSPDQTGAPPTDGWTARVTNQGADEAEVTVWAICVRK
jgi:hypothetical protein